jgi:hypothetical protein
MDSFLDVFEREPRSYAGLCLYLDSLLSGQAKIRQTRAERLNSMVQQLQLPPPAAESSQSNPIESKLSTPDSGGNLDIVPLPSVLPTVRLDEFIPRMLQGPDPETGEAMEPTKECIKDLIMNTGFSPEGLEYRPLDGADIDQFMDVFAMLGE